MSDRQYETDADTMNNETLTQAFADAGREYGFETVTAEFVPFKDFKVQWSRSYKVAQFRVSDYLADAPYEVFHGLAATLFARIAGREDVPYSEEMREWVLAPEFSEKFLFRYIERSGNLTPSPLGFHRDLNDSIKRLTEMGLIDPAAGIRTVWTMNSGGQRAASCSVLFKVIAVNIHLDDPQVPDEVLDYAVYTQWLRIVEGAKVFGKSTEVYTRPQEEKYPKFREAEKYLDNLNLFL